MRRASTAAAALLGALLAAPCRPQAASEPFAASWSVRGEPAFGRTCELEVVREWPAGAVVEAFDETPLADLRPRRIDVRRTSDGGRERETRRYAVTPWRPDRVELPAIELRARLADGSERRAASSPIAFAVATSLPDPDGGIEWLGDVRGRRSGTLWWMLGAAAAVLVAVPFARRRRAEPAAPAPEPAAAPRPSAEAALAEIAALEPGGGDPAAIAAMHVRLAEIVRTHAAERFGVRAEVRTTPELSAEVPRGAAPLAECLRACDLVKFAAARPSVADAERARAAAVAFVHAAETAAEAGP